jgi:hypothetical protein
MIDVKGPIYFLVYHSRDGPKRFEIKINPKKLCPRSEALKKLPSLVKRVRRKDKKARYFKIEEVVIFENGVNL